MPEKAESMKAYFEAMRLGRWPRSLAIFIGSTAYFFIYRQAFPTDRISWLLMRSLFVFLLTWAVSTANYVINEIADAPTDAHHPTKKNRPLVQGKIRSGPFLAMGIALAAASLFLAFRYFSQPFFYSLAALLVAGIFYNIKPLRTKDVPFLDSISESANNPIRFMIGWFAFSPNNLPPPPALLLSWWAFGNYLMVAKRLSEFRFLKDRAGDYRNSLQRYTHRTLIVVMAVSALLFFISFLYFALLFKLQSFVILSPLLLGYMAMIFHKTWSEKEVMEEPEKLMLQPKFALFTTILFIAFVLAFFLDSAGR